MTREDIQLAGELASELRNKYLKRGTKAWNKADVLVKLLQPPPTPENVLAAIPGDTHTGRAKAIGLSRQGYYNLRTGLAVPNSTVAKLMAELTGLPEETVRAAWR